MHCLLRVSWTSCRKVQCHNMMRGDQGFRSRQLQHRVFKFGTVLKTSTSEAFCDATSSFCAATPRKRTDGATRVVHGFTIHGSHDSAYAACPHSNRSQHQHNSRACLRFCANTAETGLLPQQNDEKRLRRHPARASRNIQNAKANTQHY